MGKKISALILAAVMVFSLLPSAVAGAENTNEITVKEIVSGLEYDFIGSFSEGLAVAVKDSKYGYIDKTGKLIVPCVYDSAELFKDDLAAVRIGDWTNGKLGYIDKTGKEVIPLIYDYIGDFSEGLAAMAKDGKYGCIDKTGKEIIPCVYDSIGTFENGLASVRIGEWEKGGKYGFIDKTDKEVIPLIYDDVQPFKDGLAAVKKSGKWGYIDITGKEIIPCVYDYAFVFIEGLAAVQKGSKYGFIDMEGKEVIPLVYDHTSFFDEGVAFVGKDGKTGLIDKTGNEIVPLESAYNNYYQYFSEGLAMVYINTATPDDIDAEINPYLHYKHGYIDRTGKEAIPCVYDQVSYFSEGMAAVGKYRRWYGGVIGGPEYESGYIDKTGKLIIPYIYDKANPFKEGFAVVGTGADRSVFGQINKYKYGMIDKTGKEVLPLVYDEVHGFSEGLTIAQKDGKWSIFGIVKPPTGTPIGDVLYSDITAYINSEAIPTSVINGKTLVVAEDLAKYGFDVKWNGADRSLKVEPNKSKKVNSILVEKDNAHKPGTFKCNYLYTDIKTYLSGEEVESFAIDGRTLIDFELLAKYGKLTWDGNTREIRVVTNDKFIVFWGQTGTRIHIDPDCHTFSLEINNGTLDEAKAAKRDGWCAACSGGWSDERFLKEGNPNAQKFYENQKNQANIKN